MEVTKETQIAKYIQRSLPCTNRSQTCPVHIVLLLSGYRAKNLLHLQTLNIYRT